MSSDFIELGRTFTQINIETEFTNKDSSELYGFFSYPNHVSWDEIIEVDGVSVILGEAGSGKSTEFKNQCQYRKKVGGNSFFIELENLIDKSDSTVINPHYENLFLNWEKGSEKAYFFLDSIDESKFAQRSDFKGAIYNFKRLVGIDNLARCKIILSSRFSEWHPATDLKLLEELLPENKKEYKKEDYNEPKNNSLQDPLKINKEASPEEETGKKLRIYRLNPLEESQVRLLADHNLVENPDEFIEAIDASHAWSLAKRPLDVEGLIYLWKEKGQLGSFKDILEHHIHNGLQETAERKDIDQLTPERALNGVKCLAAAVLLTKRQKFYPVDSERKANDTNVILPQSCLPDDWTDKEIKFLLQRRLFDKATFSTIKFHLRSITEFLAAKWFKDRLNSDEDYLSVQNILFKREENELVIKDSFKPIAAWLAIGNRPWNKKVRQDILKTFPELFLKYGDPSNLPTAYLLDIMKALRLKYGDSSRIYADDIVRSLSCIGKAEFATDFEDWLRDNDIGENFKYLLLRIALYSEMQGLTEIAKIFITNENHYPRTRITALHYIGKIGSKEDINYIKQYLFSEDVIENNISAATIEAFYPHSLTNKELFTLLKNTNDVKEYSVGIEYQFKRHIEAVAHSLTLKQLRALVQNLIILIKEPPLEGFLPYSKKYYWLGDGLFSATKNLLKRTDNELGIIAKAMYHLHSLKRANKGTSEIDLNIFEEIEKNPELRRSYFWYCHEMITKTRIEEPHLFHIFGGFSAISSTKIGDIEWLIQDSNIPERREKALRFVQIYWDHFNRPIKKYFHFRRVIGDDNDLKKIISISLGYYVRNIYRNIKSKFGIYDWSHWFEGKKFKLKKKRDYFRERKIIYKNIWKIYKGQHARLLLHLASQCSTDSGRYSKVNLGKLAEKYSKLIAWAFNKGVKKYWPNFTPSLPQIKSNKIDGRTIIGFTGISLSLQDKELTFSTLSDNKAQQLVFYAVNELNGYPFWLEDLARAKPNSVVKVIEECIDKDWELSENQEAIISVVSRIRTSGTYLIPLVEDYLYEKLSDSVPSTNSVLKDTLGILLHSNISNTKLRIICERNINQEVITDQEFISWLSILNKIELDSALKLIQNVLNEIKRQLLLWYSMWIQLDAENAIHSIQNLLVGLSEQQKKSFIVNLCANLESRTNYEYPTVEEPDYLNPEVFQSWFVLVYECVDPQEDIIREGSYSPGSRDDAQDFRRRLLDRFIQLHPEETKKIVDALSSHPKLVKLKDQFSHRRESTNQVLADQEIWDPKDIPKFMKEHEIDPKSTYDLFLMILKRLVNVKDEIERSEHGINLNSLRQDLIAGDDETELRKFLTNKLNDRANGKYIAVPEEELDPNVFPDIRINHGIVNPISIEIKWAQRWSGPELFKKLREQLVDQYLRAPNCNYGIYFIGFINEQNRNENWWHPRTNEINSFPQLIESLEKEALTILKENEELKGLEILAIDFN